SFAHHWMGETMKLNLSVVTIAILALTGCVASNTTTYVEHRDGTQTRITSDQYGHRATGPHSATTYWTNRGNSVESVIRHMDNAGWGGGVRSYSSGGSTSVLDNPTDRFRLQK